MVDKMTWTTERNYLKPLNGNASHSTLKPTKWSPIPATKILRQNNLKHILLHFYHTFQGLSIDVISFCDNTEKCLMEARENKISNFIKWNLTHEILPVFSQCWHEIWNLFYWHVTLAVLAKCWLRVTVTSLPGQIIPSQIIPFIVRSLHSFSVKLDVWVHFFGFLAQRKWCTHE